MDSVEDNRRREERLKAKLSSLKEFSLDADRVHVLLAVTNHDKLGQSGKKTGSNLYEVAHAYYAFTKAGFTVHFVSPLGGQAPIDPQSLLDFKEETSCQEFLTDEDALEMIQKTKSPSSIDPSQYMMIFFIGGHGALFDLPGASELQKLAGAIYELGGIIGGLCHGPAGLLNVKLANGDYLLSKQKVTGRTMKEEIHSGFTSESFPFVLEELLRNRAGTFVSESPWTPYIVKSGQLLTGQNPRSSTILVQALIDRIRAM